MKHTHFMNHIRFGCLLIFVLVSCRPVQQVNSPPSGLPASFTGSYLVALSDGDWIGQTYADGTLPTENPNMIATLTVADGNGIVAEVKGENASNAVTGTPEVMDIISGGDIIFIGELDKPRPAGATKGEEIPEGDTLRALEMRDPSQPKLLSSVTVPLSPNVVKVNPAGNLVMIGHQRNPNTAISFVTFENNQFGRPQSFTAKELGFIGEEAKNFDVQWHPSGQYISVISGAEDTLIFFEVTRDANGKVLLEPWGEPLQTGQDPNFGAKFTPDGRFLIIVNANDPRANQTLNYLFASASTLSVVRVGEVGSDKPQHEVIQEIKGGLDDESFTISPDGRYIVTMNQYGTYAPRFVPGHNNTPELRLFEIADSGEVTLLGKYDFTGYLPQGITFDEDGDTLAVSVSQQSLEQSLPGAVYFYSLVKDNAGKATLQALPERLEVMRGVHELGLGK
jgi:WD40 repeat protein